MSAPRDRGLLVLSLSDISVAFEAGLRATGAALCMWLLAHVGAAALAGFMPWAVLVLPAGATLAATWRWGLPALAGSVVGFGVAAIGCGLQPWLSVSMAAGLAVAVAAGWLVLRQVRFDDRLERPADIVALAVVVMGAVAFPLAGLLAAWMATTQSLQLFTSWLDGLAGIAIGSVTSAVGVLALARSLPAGRQSLYRMRRLALGMAGLALVLWLVWVAPIAQPPWPMLVSMLPHVLVVILVLRGQLTLATWGLIGAALLLSARMAAVTAGANSAGATAWPMPMQSGAGLVAWAGSALLLLLASHAALIDWRGRTQRWEWALDGTGMGVADWHLRRDESFVSTAWRTLTGDADAAWSAVHWQAQVHPEDRSELADAIRSLTAGEMGRRRVELRLPRPGAPTSASPSTADDWRWAEATLMVIERDSAGQPVRLLATLLDVQERRAAQERQLMSVSLFQHLHEGLLITDPDLRALDANPAYTQILGVPRDELVGTVPSLLRPAPDDPLAREQRASMWAGLASQGSWRGELLERRRNGELCTLQATISVVRGPAGDLRYHVLVISDITEQRTQRDQLVRQAHYDELTRLPNRAHLSKLLDEAMASADLTGTLLVVCYLDLDRFKPINDRFGHAAGDRLLGELAGRLRSALRSRKHWTDSAARLGGDEFVLLLFAETMDEGRLAVERVLRVVSEPYLVEAGHEAVQVTASMGATVYPLDRSDADTLLRHADNAMYEAKQAGRNGYLFFDPEHRRRAELRVVAIGRIQEALDQQEFLLHYQPKVDMKTGRVLGFEALLRWEHPDKGLIAPLQFLPLIEHTGVSSQIGDWVLSRALEHLAQWRRDGLDFAVSVNITARHLQEPDFALRLTELLARHPDLQPSLLELEITESAAHSDVAATSALMHRCRATGVRFALDDFGTGYSTLTYLKQLPVDVLKIDRSFVHHMLDDAQDRAIVEGVIGLARTFGCDAVAEGVESPAQARALLDMGCDIGQGTGIAAAMPSSQVAGWAREYRGVFALVPAQPPDAGLARLKR